MLNVKSMQLALTIVQEISENNLEVQYAIDRQLDKVEDYFEPGSLLDDVVEETCKILRNHIKVPDLEDEPEEKKKWGINIKKKKEVVKKRLSPSTPQMPSKLFVVSVSTGVQSTPL